MADLPTVQNLLSHSGELNRIEVIIEQSERREDQEYLSEIESRLLARLPEDLSLMPTINRGLTATTAAFRLNLTILSLLLWVPI